MKYKKDCFAIRETANTRRCVALNIINCEKCSFYKTYEQHVKDLIIYPWDEFKKKTPVKEIYK